MFSSLKKLKIFFVLLSIISVIFCGLGILWLYSDAKYLVGTYSVVIMGYAAMILLPIIIIGIAVFLHCLEKELKAESCGVCRQLTEQEKRLEAKLEKMK